LCYTETWAEEAPVQYTKDDLTLYRGDSKVVLPAFPENTFHSIVTDPPYSLNFMNKKWDNTGIANDVDFWKECLRVLKPGGYLLAFGGTRTFHRMACAVEDAGFDIVDTITWHTGQGFPKGLDISKAVDRYLGKEREVIDNVTVSGARYSATQATCGGTYGGTSGLYNFAPTTDVTVPSSDEAQQWSGWKTQLKPATEFISVARKPFKGTFAENILTNGVGAFNIDATRVGNEIRTNGSAGESTNASISIGSGCHPDHISTTVTGRYPPNVVFSHSPDCVEIGIKKVANTAGTHCNNRDDRGTGLGHGPEDSQSGDTVHGPDTARDGFEEVSVYRCTENCPVAELDRQSGKSKGTGKPIYAGDFGKNGVYGTAVKVETQSYDDSGTASRYFPVFKYTPKAKTSERPRYTDPTTGKTVAHPTCKPLTLMCWLVRLVTPPGGTCLDPFNGSGTTGEACALEGFAYAGIESDPQYIELTKLRWGKGT
jgi:DNA modification methylase